MRSTSVRGRAVWVLAVTPVNVIETGATCQHIVRRPRRWSPRRMLRQPAPLDDQPLSGPPTTRATTPSAARAPAAGQVASTWPSLPAAGMVTRVTRTSVPPRRWEASEALVPTRPSGTTNEELTLSGAWPRLTTRATVWPFVIGWPSAGKDPRTAPSGCAERTRTHRTLTPRPMSSLTAASRCRPIRPEGTALPSAGAEVVGGVEDGADELAAGLPVAGGVAGSEPDSRT